MEKLTPKQKAFCNYYLQSFNATEAAIKAGYSSKSAKVIGAENLTKPYIQDYIQSRVQQKENKRIMQADEVLERLTALARGEAEAGAKEQIKCLELLGKSHKLFIEKIEQDVTSEIEVTITVV